MTMIHRLSRGAASMRAMGLSSAFLLPLLAGQEAWADCTFLPGSDTEDYILPIPPEILVPVLGGAWEGVALFNPTAIHTTAHVNCIAPYQQAFGMSNPSFYLPGTYWPTYATNLPGLGFLAQDGGHNGADPWGSWATWPKTTIDWTHDEVRHHGRRRALNLIVTAPYVKGGVLQLPDPFMEETMGGLVLSRVRFDRSTVIIRPIQPTCTVNPGSADISIDFGSLALNGPGSQSPVEPITVTLDCYGGEPGRQRTIHMSLSDSNDPGNTSDVLSFDAGSSAQGAGIRITRDAGIPVRFGPPATTVGAPHQWRAGVTPTGAPQFTIPMAAAIIQTAPALVSGEFNAQATFTLAYE